MTLSGSQPLPTPNVNIVIGAELNTLLEVKKKPKQNNSSIPTIKSKTCVTNYRVYCKKQFCKSLINQVKRSASLCYWLTPHLTS